MKISCSTNRNGNKVIKEVVSTCSVVLKISRKVLLYIYCNVLQPYLWVRAQYLRFWLRWPFKYFCPMVAYTKITRVPLLTWPYFCDIISDQAHTVTHCATHISEGKGWGGGGVVGRSRPRAPRSANQNNFIKHDHTPC